MATFTLGPFLLTAGEVPPSLTGIKFFKELGCLPLPSIGLFSSKIDLDPEFLFGILNSFSILSHIDPVLIPLSTYSIFFLFKVLLSFPLVLLILSLYKSLLSGELQEFVLLYIIPRSSGKLSIIYILGF